MNLLDYIKGSKKGKDAHHLEKKAMTDPFLSDALEGFDTVEGNHIERIMHLQSQITGKTQKKSNKVMIWGIAASILLCISIGGYFLTQNEKQDDLYSKSLKQEKNTLPSVPKEIVTEAPEIDKRPMLTDEKLPLPVVAKTKQEVTIANEILESDAISSEEIVVEKIENKDSNLLGDFMLSEQSAKSKLSLELDSSPALYYSLDNQLAGKIAGVNTRSSKNVLRGKIVDQAGEPLIGAGIIQKKTGLGTVSDSDGYFSLNSTDLKEPLTIQYLGYDSKEIPIDTSKTMLIAMDESQKMLDEVVVIGYGSRKKQSITGSVSTVRDMKFEDKKEKDKKPEPVIGMKAYKKYLKENIILPDDNFCGKVKGKVTLTFNINASGKPYNIQVKKALCSSLDAEAIRLVTEGPDWTTGNKEIELQVEF